MGSLSGLSDPRVGEILMKLESETWGVEIVNTADLRLLYTYFELIQNDIKTTPKGSYISREALDGYLHLIKYHGLLGQLKTRQGFLLDEDMRYLNLIKITLQGKLNESIVIYSSLTKNKRGKTLAVINLVAEKLKEDFLQVQTVIDSERLIADKEERRLGEEKLKAKEDEMKAEAKRLADLEELLIQEINGFTYEELGELISSVNATGRNSEYIQANVATAFFKAIDYTGSGADFSTVTGQLTCKDICVIEENFESIRAAYKEAMRRFHPDRHRENLKIKAAAQFSSFIQGVYDELETEFQKAHKENLFISMELPETLTEGHIEVVNSAFRKRNWFKLVEKSNVGKYVEKYLIMLNEETDAKRFTIGIVKSLYALLGIDVVPEYFAFVGNLNEKEILDVAEVLRTVDTKYELVLNSYHIDKAEISKDIWKDQIYSLVSAFLRSAVKNFGTEAEEIKREFRRRRYEGVDDGKEPQLDEFPINLIEHYLLEFPKLDEENRFITWEILETFLSLIGFQGLDITDKYGSLTNEDFEFLLSATTRITILCYSCKQRMTDLLQTTPCKIYSRFLDITCDKVIKDVDQARKNLHDKENEHKTHSGGIDGGKEEDMFFEADSSEIPHRGAAKSDEAWREFNPDIPDGPHESGARSNKGEIELDPESIKSHHREGPASYAEHGSKAYDRGDDPSSETESSERSFDPEGKDFSSIRSDPEDKAPSDASFDPEDRALSEESLDPEDVIEDSLKLMDPPIRVDQKKKKTYAMREANPMLLDWSDPSVSHEDRQRFVEEYNKMKEEYTKRVRTMIERDKILIQIEEDAMNEAMESKNHGEYIDLFIDWSKQFHERLHRYKTLKGIFKNAIRELRIKYFSVVSV